MDILVLIICVLACLTSSLGQFCRRRYPCRSCNFSIIRDQRICSLYYVCFNGQSYRFNCERGFVYSVHTRTCVPEDSRYNDCPSATTTTTTTTPRPTTQRPTIRPTDVKPNPGQSSCGIVIETLIVNGQAAGEGRWPWQVSLQLKTGFYSFHYCGGVLINKQWVMTAGHCLKGRTANDFYLVLGSNSKTYWTSDAVVRNIDRMFVHPNFVNSGGYPNDIALIKMSEPVVFKEGVAPACMPNVGEQFLGRECYITGFGDTKGTGNDNVLNEIKINVIQNSRCSSSWGYGRIEDSHICVGDGLSGACRGDSGGPLVCVNAFGRFVLAGVTSWGFQTCTQFGYPNVYTRVSSHLQWVNSIIINNRT